MLKMTGIAGFAAVIGFALLIVPNIAKAQIEGAVQYPPVSVGEDAQPPPPARMAPQSVSPRRIELATSGSSQVPANILYRMRSRLDIDESIRARAPLLPSSLTPPSSAGGN
jgi:hypothetical protein